MRIQLNDLTEVIIRNIIQRPWGYDIVADITIQHNDKIKTFAEIIEYKATSPLTDNIIIELLTERTNRIIAIRENFVDNNSEVQ